MRTGLASLVVALMLLPGLPTATAEAQTDTPGVSTPTMEIPASAVGDQLVWILAQLNGGATTLTEADVRAHFAPAFLMDVLPAPILLDLLRRTAAEYAPVTFTGFAFPPTATGAVAHIDLVDPGTGEQVAIYVTIEPDPPYRVTRLDLNEAPAPPSPTGQRVDVGGRALPRLHGQWWPDGRARRRHHVRLGGGATGCGRVHPRLQLRPAGLSR